MDAKNIPETDEERIRWIAEKCFRLDNPRSVFPYLNKVLKISRHRFVELTNTKEFLELIDKYKMTFVYLPRLLEMKKKQLQRAVNGDIKAEEALLKSLANQEIIIERTDSLKIGMNQLAAIMQRNVLNLQEPVDAEVVQEGD